MAELLKEQKLLTKSQIESKTDTKDASSAEDLIKGKVTALLFSAAWCPPCSKFLPILKTFYQDLKDAECAFEIIFVSLDHTKETMAEFFTRYHGNWLAFPFDDPSKESIINKYHITAIPKLVVIRENGEVITLRGRKDVQDKGTSCFRAWLNNSIPKENRNNLNLQQEGENQGDSSIVDANTENIALRDNFLENVDNLDSIQSEIIAQMIDATVYPEDRKPEAKASESDIQIEASNQTSSPRLATNEDNTKEMALNSREITTILEETD